MNKLTALAFVLLWASVSPVFANKEHCRTENKNERTGETVNNLLLEGKGFGYGLIAGSAITGTVALALYLKYGRK